MDLALALQGREFKRLALPPRPGGAYAQQRRLPDPPKAIPFAPRFEENMAQAWVHLLTGVDADAQAVCSQLLLDTVTPRGAFATAHLSCRPNILIKDLRWETELFPVETKSIPASMPLVQKDFTNWFTRAREIANVASNLEFPLAMLEAFTQEETHPMAPSREEGPWMGLLYPFVQAAKDNLEALQKLAAESLIQATLFGRDALLAKVKVGLGYGQTVPCRPVHRWLLHTMVLCLQDEVLQDEATQAGLRAAPLGKGVALHEVQQAKKACKAAADEARRKTAEDRMLSAVESFGRHQPKTTAANSGPSTTYKPPIKRWRPAPTQTAKATTDKPAHKEPAPEATRATGGRAPKSAPPFRNATRANKGGKPKANNHWRK
jgi:hypothetical protein